MYFIVSSLLFYLSSFFFQSECLNKTLSISNLKDKRLKRKIQDLILKREINARFAGLTSNRYRFISLKRQMLFMWDKKRKIHLNIPLY